MMIDFTEPIYSYDKFISDAKSLAKQYNSLIQYVTIGRSHDNRDIVLLKLGTGFKYMIICGGVHGRETINTIVLMRLIEHYAKLYTNHKKEKESLLKGLNDPTLYLSSEYKHMIYGACIFELLQTFTILFVPLLNPDGYMISLYGYDAIRNKRLKEICQKTEIPFQEWKYNARGIDINRNFPSRLWKPKAPSDYAASENETKALISLFHGFKTRGFLDFHSRGRSIYYHRKEMSSSYNEKQLEIALRLKEITGYVLVPPEEEVETGDTGGNTVHYYSERFHKTALTIETVEETASFPLDYSYRETTYEEIKYIIFEFGSMII